MSGVKLDSGKLEFDLLPWDEIEKIVRVLMWGRDKYGLDNWRTVKDGYKRFRRAALRHLIADTKGEEKDPETGSEHLIQTALACLMASWHRGKTKYYDPKKMAEVKKLDENKLAGRGKEFEEYE